eukprot:TRINITY_DN8875_c0_g1_i1.p2 TRINITY_DN8875_c0_g1~~TRINITY_DN8875_c0_g1_i1.p2  ORF type:complete len:138 (+),score=17.81 TRINITY_DN8875_c0_g1_i1:87-500(+)
MLRTRFLIALFLLTSLGEKYDFHEELRNLTLKHDTCLWTPNHFYLFVSNVTASVMSTRCPLNMKFLNCTFAKFYASNDPSCIYSELTDTLCLGYELGSETKLQKRLKYKVFFQVSGSCGSSGINAEYGEARNFFPLG